MDKRLISAVLLDRVCDEIDVRRNISMRDDRRYRSIVYYRAMLVVIFRDEYTLSYQNLGDQLHKNHATIINSYKKGKALLDMKYDDIHKIYKDVKSIVSYCEVMMGISSDEEAIVSDTVMRALEVAMDKVDITTNRKAMIAYNIINKINEKYCI